MIPLAPASFFSYVVLNTGMGGQLVEFIKSITTNRYAVLSLVVLFLLIIGCGLDTLAMLFIFVPVLFPAVTAVGVDPLHFIAVFVLCLGIALLTPPVGIVLFMVTDISQSPLTEVIRETLPFFLVQILVLALVTYLPFLSTWLPGLLMS